ncbi:G-alpha-domain-containing protein [Macrolepiota fuliginosa MF-IS2]|uniref:G-alpha-domain-containing protein n=1 Tax=Macrolepiota fuliginosa MF-IS2 TaxID=1400762 RepID=A0A9P6C3W2_9AGAR|nr:G-alpha-domain-containing protein [Macrolepiota fuliginosa MF-IS2]
MPPEFETPEERDWRLQKEEEAKRVSNAIDEELNKERKAPKPVKILLLGKSTTLKNFQLMHEPKAFGKERASWRAVIYLNIVRSFHLIMDAMDRAQGRTVMAGDHEDGEFLELPRLSAEHLKIKRRLSPLLQVEDGLMNQISPVQSADREITHPGRTSLKEIAVNSATQWKDAFGRLVRGGRLCEDLEDMDWGDPNNPGKLLNACSEDMVRLWHDPVIQELLLRLKIRMEDHAGFFLDSLERVTAARYLPTDDDILRARLKTLGVSEHQFRMKTSTGVSKDWRIYDVGGHRSQVTAWVPFFDDMDAIIFLAPISAFDQMLEEDPKVNRLLWINLVSNELLSRTNIILFLNKFDIFQAKIEAGIPLARYVTSYRNRPNDVTSTSEYLQKKFAALMKSHTKLPRMFYSHFTTVTDTKSTKYVLSNLQDMLMRQNFAECDLT